MRTSDTRIRSASGLGEQIFLMTERWKYRIAVWGAVVVTAAVLLALYRNVEESTFLWVLVTLVALGGFVVDYFVSRRGKS
jgi:hypothetical protein